MFKLKLQNSNTLQATWLGMGSLSSFTLAIVSAAILSRYFNKTEYGTYRQILYVYSTLIVIFSAGLPNVFSYFLPRFDLQQGKSIINKISKMLFISGAAFSMVLFVFSEQIASVLKNPDLTKGLKVFSPIPMMLLPTLGIEGIFSTYKKTYYIAIYNTLTRVLMLLFIVLPVIIFKGTYLYAIYGWIVVSFISLLLAFYFQGLPFKGIKSEKVLLTNKEVLLFSLPIATASLWGIAIKSADQFYISRYFGTEVFAEFSNGFLELPFVGMITAAASTVLMPIFSKMIHEKSDVGDIITLWRNVLRKSAIIIYPMVIFFIFNAKTLIVLLYSEAYINSAIYFQIAMVLNLFNIIIFAPLLFAMGKTKFYSRIHMVFAFMTWTIEYIVVLIFNSPIAVAGFSIIMAILRILISFGYISKVLKIRFDLILPLKSISMLIIHSFITLTILKVLLYLFLPHLENFVALIVIFAGFLITLIYTGKFLNINYFMVFEDIFKNVKKNDINI